MRGRAGRKGKDEVGETYLCCRQADMEDVVDLMHADIPRLESCLISDQRRIRRLAIPFHLPVGIANIGSELC